MSGTVTQPPYLILAQAARDQNVQDIVEMAAMRVAMLVMQASGGPVLIEPTTPPIAESAKSARVGLARAALGRKVPRDLMALALLQAPDVAAAVSSDQSNPAAAMMTVDIANAWARNWTDFALMIQS